MDKMGKIRKNREERILSRYNWIIAEPYYDKVIDNGSTNRSRNFITFREFKKLLDDGETIEQIREKGVSKHLLQFFSNFLQGKIGLSRDEFIIHYEHDGMSLDEISKEYNISREDTTYLRQLYDIKRKGATFIKRKKNDIALTHYQKQLIYGSLMGDAKRQHTKWNSSVGFGQSKKQKDYLLWKASILYNLISDNAVKEYKSFDKRYNKYNISWRFYTVANTEIENILIKFYNSGEKKISREILDNLDSFSIAVWHMDDGCVDWRRRDRLKGWYPSPEIKLCTDSFSVEDVETIVQWFKDKYGINSRWRYHRKDKHPRIVINSDSIDEYLDIVSPHIIPSMLYKVNYESWKKKNLPSETK